MRASRLVWPSFSPLLMICALIGARARAHEILLVSPSELADVEGNSGHEGCCLGGLRRQQMFAASQFESLPDDHRLLVRLAFRPDSSVTRPRTVQWDDLKIRMATTPLGFPGLYSVFDENIEPDPTTVYEGPLTLSTNSTGPPAGPKDFDQVVQLQTPYWYDSSKGDLVIDWVSESGSSQPPAWDGTSVVGSAMLIGASSPTAKSLEWSWGGTAFQFTFTSQQPEVTLQAGDADQDLDFDQLDLVQVQIAGKYLSGRAATWGEGDWNGAPGGTPGIPPTGDGLFNQLDIVAAQQAALYLTGRYAAAQGSTLVVVPEPGTCVPLAVAMLVMFLCRASRRRLL